MKMVILKTVLVFLLAGICEIGGGYMVWLWLRENKPWWIGAVGLIFLALYGIIATLQPANFGRVYAAYGGIFIIMAVWWGWKVDKIRPDTYDIIGAVICLLGAYLIFFAPRK
ncbi:YnfA family protein [Paraflavitalea pollutisoli]|uniref:YnfA family protein n=1 Tax=Paraflavitalea pollutisoli TaxID=3034143 RepID=UPI0023EC6AFD|nr:YnfA family protein [Paraflavitalea sp. H1-2-19X]